MFSTLVALSWCFLIRFSWILCFSHHMQNEELAPFATGEVASMRSLILAFWRPFESFGLVWELSPVSHILFQMS